MKKNKKAPTFVNTQILILIIYRVYLAFHTYFILQHLQVDIDSGINLPLFSYSKVQVNQRKTSLKKHIYIFLTDEGQVHR